MLRKCVKEDEEQAVADVEDSPGERETNDGSYAVALKLEEEDEHVFGSNPLMMCVSEKPAPSPGTSSDDSLDSLADRGGEGSAVSPGADSSLSLAGQPGQPGPVLLGPIDLDDVVAKQVDECIEKEMKALLRPLEAKYSALWAGICQGLRNTERMQRKLSELILVDRWLRHGQEPAADLVCLSKRGAHALGPLSKVTPSHGPAYRKKHRYSYPGTSWRRQLQKSAAKRRQERLSAALERQKSNPDSHGAPQNGYRSSHFEVHSAVLAKCQQNCTEACGLSTRRGKEDSPEEPPENSIPCHIELQSGIPYNSESFLDAPYSIGLE